MAAQEMILRALVLYISAHGRVECMYISPLHVIGHYCLEHDCVVGLSLSVVLPLSS